MQKPKLIFVSTDVNSGVEVTTRIDVDAQLIDGLEWEDALGDVRKMAISDLSGVECFADLNSAGSLVEVCTGGNCTALSPEKGVAWAFGNDDGDYILVTEYGDSVAPEDCDTAILVGLYSKDSEMIGACALFGVSAFEKYLLDEDIQVHVGHGHEDGSGLSRAMLAFVAQKIAADMKHEHQQGNYFAITDEFGYVRTVAKNMVTHKVMREITQPVMVSMLNNEEGVQYVG